MIKEKLIIQEIHNCRFMVIEAVEQELGNSERWPNIRSRILKYFGSRGLEKKIMEILRHNVGTNNELPQ